METKKKDVYYIAYTTVARQRILNKQVATAQKARGEEKTKNDGDMVMRWKTIESVTVDVVFVVAACSLGAWLEFVEAEIGHFQNPTAVDQTVRVL